MARSWPHLARAPIAEALLNLRVELPPGRRLDELKALAKLVDGEYPRIMEARDWKVDLQVGPAGRQRVEQSTESTALVFSSEDGLQVLQARLDGFALSRLSPCETWDRLRDETRRLWRHYVEVAKPSRVVGVGVRYVNRILIPVPSELSDYIHMAPAMPVELPREVSSFFTQVRMPFREQLATCVVTLASEPETQPASDRRRILFDINAFRELNELPRDEHVFQVLEHLRHVKNDVFFHGVTQRCLEMFQ